MKTVICLLFLLSFAISCQPKVRPKPTANFDLVIGNNGQVQFTNKSEEADRFQWIFSDGQATTEQNPIITFKKNGTYSAQLSAKSLAGSDDITKSVDIINVAAALKPIANFDFTVGTEGQVKFTNKSVNADRYQWVFGDGQAATEQSPTIIFRKNGIYLVQLVAKSTEGVDDVSKSVEIKDISTTGTILFWSNAGKASDIEIYVDNQLRGIINQSQAAAPDCGAEGYVTLSYPAGTYSYYAKSKTRSWSGTFVVKNAACSTKLLTE